MLMGLNQYNELVYAQHAKIDDLYRCPECLSELIIKKGKHTTAHFAHKSSSLCIRNRYKRESIDHLSSKHDIYKSLNGLIQVDMEYYLSEIDQIPDILINKKIVIEFQFSPINLDLLISRTEGFKSLNLQVIWIGKNAHYHDGMLYLTIFQAALINHEDRTFITYNPTTKCLIRYKDVQVIDQHKFLANKEQIVWRDLLEITNIREIPSLFLNDCEYYQYIRKCRKNRSVLEPTLSLLYQSGLIHKERLDIIGIIVPEQIYILTHCITWQSYVFFEIKNGTFSFERCLEFIKFRTFYNNSYSRECVLKKAIHSYLKIIQVKFISRAKISK
ncbi:competence protein CoiA [Mammaliicoccus stepanovicii]|uniref:Transcription factor n=1 Tax=Mammaliicoccus stepanovicii TaxID=643214 RepID=A0A239ZT43_9STAP|nr:competence protein CoiA family protein [Mammaliicoccus stepanovicii]PNZ77083.1 hypothetical protein CD111_05215 [Mammaliicoccus stepanovicii]GGI38833.1 transcription factor [Mammaliicoccus stepanovicii]SNV74030.1 transcription factor [Mammaliicoccus stepanovicii]